MLNLVIVDDEIRIREGLAKVIQSANREVRIVGSFGNGRTACDFILSQPEEAIDLVMTDIMMPAMDGLQLIGKLKASRRHLKFVIISGFHDFEYARQGLKYGVLDYLTKPINFDEVVRIIDEFINPDTDADDDASERATHSIELEDGHWIIEKVKEIIQRQYHLDLNLKMLADEVYLSPFYLSKLFSREVGMTLSDYITNVRLTKAKQLLEHQPTLKVYEVSQKVGYLDSTYFNRLFKKQVGVTPNEYKMKK